MIRKLFVLISLAASACGDSTGPGTMARGTFEATVDGHAISGPSIYSTSGGAEGELDIFLSAGPEGLVRFTRDNGGIPGPGDYPLIGPGLTGNEFLGSFTDADDRKAWSSGGSLTITAISDSTIEGTFDFTVTGDDGGWGSVAGGDGSGGNSGGGGSRTIKGAFSAALKLLTVEASTARR